MKMNCGKSWGYIQEWITGSNCVCHVYSSAWHDVRLNSVGVVIEIQYSLSDFLDI